MSDIFSTSISASSSRAEEISALTEGLLINAALKNTVLKLLS